MPFQTVLPLRELPAGSKKAVKVGETEILLIHTEEGALYALEAKCPHAGAPLEQGAICDGRLICPWHTGTFTLATGALIEPPPLRSLKRYAAHISGDAVLVDPMPLNAPSLAHYDDQEPGPQTGADLHFLTIGGGAAAAAAISALRQGGFAGRITVIDPVADEPVDRTNLSKLSLAGKKPLDTLPIWETEAKTRLKVERMLARVTHLDGTAGTLRAGDGPEVRFDAALLAPGGVTLKLSIPGEDAPHVFTIRHIADVDAIGKRISPEPKGKRVVLIGDSFIAFEAASSLTARGLGATVVARSPQPFSQKFGEGPAQTILNLHQANGVTLKLGAEAREITPEAVALKSGETLPADLVIIAIGVRVATDFEHGLPLADDGGVRVDETLRAAPKLWVAGDAASVNGTRIEHWRLAEQHGRVAAAGMLGTEEARFEGVPFFWTTHFGKRFGYVGHAGEWDDLQVDGALGGDGTDPKFLAYYLKGGEVKAISGCGRDTAMATLTDRMREKLTLAEARAAAGSATA